MYGHCEIYCIKPNQPTDKNDLPIIHQCATKWSFSAKRSANSLWTMWSIGTVYPRPLFWKKVKYNYFNLFKYTKYSQINYEIQGYIYLGYFYQNELYFLHSMCSSQETYIFESSYFNWKRLNNIEMLLLDYNEFSYIFCSHIIGS